MTPTLTKTLRDQLPAILGWGTGLGLITLLTAEQYPQFLAGAVGTRAEQVEQVTKVSRAFQVLSGQVVPADTVGSYVTGRTLGMVACVLSLWAVAAIVAALRGDEDTGALDALAAGPTSRRSVLLQKLAGVWLALVPMSLLVWLGLWAGCAMAGEPMPIPESLLALLNCAVFAAFWASVGAFLAQYIAPRRKASWIGIALIMGTFIFNNIVQSSDALHDLIFATPWSLYFLSMPLATSLSIEWGAIATLCALAAAFTLASAAIFSRRDLGNAPSKAQGGKTVMLGSVWGRALRDQLAPALLWGGLLGTISAIFASTIKEGLEAIREISANTTGWLGQVFGVLSTPEAYLQVGLLLYAQVIPVLFAITQVMAWAGDEEEGRLELQVALPAPRYKELLARFLALILGLACITTLGGLGTLTGAAIYGITIDIPRVLLATYSAGLLGAVIGTAGIAIATFLRRPGTAVIIMVGAVVLMYFYNLFSTLWDIPEALRNLSIFHVYGRPLTEAFNTGNMLALAALSLAALLTAITGLNRRDVAK